jgi:hypothetical protein
MNRLRITRTWLLALWLGLLTAALPLAAFAQTGDDGAIAAGFTLFWCFCLILWLVIIVGSCWWIYNDAQKRGLPNGLLWAVLNFFFFPIGLLLYLILGRNQTPTGGAPPTGPAGPSNTVRY